MNIRIKFLDTERCRAKGLAGVEKDIDVDMIGGFILGTTNLYTKSFGGDHDVEFMPSLVEENLTTLASKIKQLVG